MTWPPGWYVIEDPHQDPARVISGPHDDSEEASRTASIFATGPGRIMLTPALVDAVKNRDYNVEWGEDVEKPAPLREGVDDVE